MKQSIKKRDEWKSDREIVEHIRKKGRESTGEKLDEIKPTQSGQ